MEFEEILDWLKEEDATRLTELFDKAYQCKLKTVGNKVYFRGIIEFSNQCIKNCYYCGIRRGNKVVQRFLMTEEDILNSALWAYHNRYGSIVLQSGERNDYEYIDFVDSIIRKIRAQTDNRLGITLSLGEQTEDTYRRWFESGAHRYLLRIETSNPKLYQKLHPIDHDFQKRLSCLELLKKIGYQTGTGVMIGLPEQTLEDLANDILFFGKMDIDMIGMGPYITHHDTPLYDKLHEDKRYKETNLNLGLKMIALTRLHLPDVNIASTTALQALHPAGREKGLKAGANIIMPIITDIKYRANYLLYDGKPCIDDNADDCKSCLEGRIKLVGETIGYDEWGDSPHFGHKKNADN